MSLAQRMHFLQDAIAFVLVINHYHTNGLHLFWDTLYLSTCQRTRQNVFEYLLSNNLKIRKESPNSSLEEKPRMLPQPPPSEREKEKKRKKTQQKRILPSTPVDRHPQSYLKYQ